jgi:hypothetical protein
VHTQGTCVQETLTKYSSAVRCFHKLLNVLVQIANKMGLQKKSISSRIEHNGVARHDKVKKDETGGLRREHDSDLQCVKYFVRPTRREKLGNFGMDDGGKKKVKLSP